ncbi:MAG TPA: DUF922 domain-containing protein [bacterium]
MRNAIGLALAAMSLGLTCSSYHTFSTKQPENLDQMVQRQFSKKNVIFWDEDVVLGWDDFELSFKTKQSYHAQSATGIYSFWNCDSGKFEFIVGSVFDRDGSWVMNWVRYDTRRKGFLLNHEQSHFDLTEVYARRIRRTLSGLKQPCTLSREILNGIVNRFIEEFQEEEKRYDQETDHGLDEDKQFAWNQRIYQELRDLEKFKLRKYSFVL